MALQYATAEAAPDPYLSVLLEVMGEELLKAATACLPIQVKGSAALYPGCDADAQLRLINAAYHWLDAAYDTGRALKAKTKPKGELTDDTVLFQLNIHDSREQVAVTPRIARRIVEYYALIGRNDDARKVGDLLEFVLLRREGADNGDIDHEAANLVIDYFLSHASELAQEEWIQEFTEREYTSDMVLPAEYGKLGIAPGVPSCLGMSLMLSAFARLTGLPVMLVNPLSLNLDQELAVNKVYSQAIIDHLVAIKSSNTAYQEALQRQVGTAEGYVGRVTDFHYSIAMKLVDGRWVHLDPYMNSFGAFGDEWELDRIYDALLKYKDVLPGLTLVGNDGGKTEQWAKKWYAWFDQAIATAEHLLHAIEEIPCVIEVDADEGLWDIPEYDVYDYDFLWMFGTLMDATDVYELAFEVFKHQGRELNEDAYQRIEQAGISEITKLMFKGSRAEGDDEMELVFESFAIRFNEDPEFQRKTLEKVVLSLVDWIVGEWNADVGKTATRLLDPTMQFSLPEYNLGLAVTSHVRSWTYPDIPGRLLVGLSSSQILWHDAVDLSQGHEQSDMNHPDVMRAETMVRAQPHHHAACESKLRYIAGLRQEGNSNAQETQCEEGC